MHHHRDPSELALEGLFVALAMLCAILLLARGCN